MTRKELEFQEFISESFRLRLSKTGRIVGNEEALDGLALKTSVIWMPTGSRSDNDQRLVFDGEKYWLLTGSDVYED